MAKAKHSRREKTGHRGHTEQAGGESLVVEDGVLDLDEAAEVIPFNYAITAYGADYPVDGLIKRLENADISIPLFSVTPKRGTLTARFQREFVWKKIQSDRFVESLLLGLPVPGIFLVKEADGKLLVLDGHQRLQTLLRFYSGLWENAPYTLEGVQDRFQNKTYEQLDTEDRRRLDDSIIHATVVRQDEPSDDQSSIYLVFERLNSGGTILQPQEIRIALYHGPFVTLLSELNELKSWRTLFGRRSKRLKDIELILRFFALFESSKHYSRPMKGFLNAYIARRRKLTSDTQDTFSSLFSNTTQAILRGIGPKALRLKSAVNVALADAVLVGTARRIHANGAIAQPKSLKSAYEGLLRDKAFQRAIERATADEESVKNRLQLATEAFSSVR